jgi:hypothetical protein
MTRTLTLYDPTASGHEDGTHAAHGMAGLAGKTVGFIDNAKPNFSHLVDDLAELLVSRHGVARVVKRRKKSASVPAPEDMLREVADACDLVITGSGD